MAFRRAAASPSIPRCFCTDSVAASETRLFVRLPNRWAEAVWAMKAAITKAKANEKSRVDFMAQTFRQRMQKHDRCQRKGLVSFSAAADPAAKLGDVEGIALEGF